MLDAVDLLLAPRPAQLDCCGGPPDRSLWPTDLARMVDCPTHGVNPHPPQPGSRRRYEGALRHRRLARRDLTTQQWRGLAIAVLVTAATALLLALETGAWTP